LIGSRQNGVIRFSRVPYAAPPVQGRRFLLPEPLPAWDEPLDCTGSGAVPPQLPSRLAKVMGHYPARQDEDCLHLDIWVPEELTAKAPVFVFLHGGAFMTGGGSLPCYDGSVLAARSGMIVVNVSYRLGALGFLPIRGVAPANLGLHDQISALRWIRKAAHSFGADADNVTAAGQSAGAYSIALLLATSNGQALFNRAIMMSAPLGLELPTADALERLGQAYMDTLGLASGDRSGLQELPVERLLGAQLKLLQARGGAPGDVTPPFVPAIDGELVPTDPRKALTQDAVVCDLMIGTTREEMAAFYYGDESLAKIAADAASAAFRRHHGDEAEHAMRRARTRRVPNTPVAHLGDLMTDIVFAGPSLDLARAQAAQGRTPFVYRFDWQSPTRGIQACHCIELPFLFGNLDIWQAAPMLAGADMREVADLSRIFQGALAAFARSGRPEGLDLPAWPDYGERRAVQYFDKAISVSEAA
jgi:para-nitrobenzyl esterase